MACPKAGIMLALMVAVLWAGAEAQSSSSCTNTLASMSPCLDYITGNSSSPSSRCCSQLASVVRSQPQCLCQAISGGGSSLGVNVNKTQALALPSACNVQTPSISRCNAASPADSPSGTPDTGSSGTVPSTDGSSPSNASSMKTTFSLLFSLLLVASYASTSRIC